MLHIIEDDFLYFQFFQYISNYFISNKTVSLSRVQKEKLSLLKIQKFSIKNCFITPL